MAINVHWVLPDIKDAKPTSVQYSDSDTVDVFLKKAVKECGQLTNHIYVDIIFDGRVLRRDALVAQYKTSVDNPFILGMTEGIYNISYIITYILCNYIALITEMKNMTIKEVAKLKSRVAIWKPKREKTLKALEDLAVNADNKCFWNNQLKFWGALGSVAVTVGGIAAVGMTGGLATPFVVGGFVAAIGSTAAVGYADYLNTLCSSDKRTECQTELDKEMTSYESVRECLITLQDNLEKLSIDRGWPAQEALPAVISLSSVVIEGVTVTGKGATRFMLASWTAMDIVADYYKVVDAAIDAVDGAGKAAEGARAVAEAARKLNLADVVRATETAAEAAETAAQATKSFKTTKEAAAAIENAMQASKAAVTAAADGAERINKLANMVTGLRATSPLKAAANQGAKAAEQGVKLAAEGAEAVSKAGKLAAKAGRFFARAVPYLNIISLLLDFNDICQSAWNAFGGQSAVGKHIRGEAKKLADQMKCIEDEVIPQLEKDIKFEKPQ